MEEPIEFEWMRGNLFKITDPNTGIVRIAEARIVAECIARAARCYRDYRTAAGADIIPFPERTDAAH
jgi:hypothetical protein